MRTDNFSFQSFDNTAINVLKLIPQKAQEGKVPSVLFHPGNRCTPDDYRWLLEPLCREGYLVYGIYQRGYGSGTPNVNDRGGLIQQKDMQIALQLIKQDDWSDENRIACVGHSNGAHMVQRLAAIDSFKCGVAMSQVSDWALFISSSKDYLPDYYARVIAEFGGPPETNPQPYIDRSCLHLAKDIKIPILTICGEDDALTPIHFSRMMYEELKNQGNSAAELLIIPGAGHFFEVYAFDGYLTDQVTAEVLKWLAVNL